MLSFGKLNYHRSDIRLFGIQSLARLPLDIRAKVKQTRHKTMTVKVYSPLPVHNVYVHGLWLCMCCCMIDFTIWARMHAWSLTHSHRRACINCLQNHCQHYLLLPHALMFGSLRSLVSASHHLHVCAYVCIRFCRVYCLCMYFLWFFLCGSFSLLMCGFFTA